jgi:hypothetical protein
MWCIVARMPSCPRTVLHRVQAYVFHHSRENDRWEGPKPDVFHHNRENDRRRRPGVTVSQHKCENDRTERVTTTRR